MNTNGVNGNALTSRPLEALGMSLEKRPVIWGSALKLCRIAAGMKSIPDLINKVFRNSTKKEVSNGDVAKWEAGDAYPSLRQCKALRAFLPQLKQYEDLLRLDLREDPKHKDISVASAPDETPKGWIGPPVASFGAGLRACREKAGMKQGDVALAMGVVPSTVGAWETDGRNKPQDFRVIQEVYDRLCELFPMLRFAPRPPMSTKYNNQFKTGAWLEARDARGEQARESHAVNLAIVAHDEQKRIEAEASKPPPIDHAPATMAGATYGALKSELFVLQAKKTKMEAEHKIAIDRVTQEIEAKREEAATAEREMMRVAGATHGIDL